MRWQAAAAVVLGIAAASPHARDRDPAAHFRNGWSAAEMIGTDVRGRNGREIGRVKDILVDASGKVSRVVVEVGGILEMADQHIGVPWRDVRIGPDMEYVHVPLREVQRGSYSLFGRVPEGEDVQPAPEAWRVNELIGEFAGLHDVPRYGLVTDVIFDPRGKAIGVIVERKAGPWGTAGWYGYPFTGYDPAAPVYRLPYDSAEVGGKAVSGGA